MRWRGEGSVLLRAEADAAPLQVLARSSAAVVSVAQRFWSRPQDFFSPDQLSLLSALGPGLGPASPTLPGPRGREHLAHRPLQPFAGPGTTSPSPATRADAPRANFFDGVTQTGTDAPREVNSSHAAPGAQFSGATLTERAHRTKGQRSQDAPSTHTCHCHSAVLLASPSACWPLEWVARV